MLLLGKTILDSSYIILDLGPRIKLEERKYYYKVLNFQLLLNNYNHKIHKSYIQKLEKFKGLLIRNLNCKYTSFKDLEGFLFKLYFFSVNNNFNIYLENNFNEKDNNFIRNFFKKANDFIILE